MDYPLIKSQVDCSYNQIIKPIPNSHLASSLAKRIFASFDWLYIYISPLYGSAGHPNPFSLADKKYGLFSSFIMLLLASIYKAVSHKVQFHSSITYIIHGLPCLMLKLIEYWRPFGHCLSLIDWGRIFCAKQLSYVCTSNNAACSMSTFYICIRSGTLCECAKQFSTMYTSNMWVSA